MVLPNLSELKMIVSRLSHVAEDVTLAANHVSAQVFLNLFIVLNLSEWHTGAPRQIEQRADEHDVEQPPHPNDE